MKINKSLITMITIQYISRSLDSTNILIEYIFNLDLCHLYSQDIIDFLCYFSLHLLPFNSLRSTGFRRFTKLFDL